METKSGGKKKFDAYIEAVKDQQKSVLWPDVLRGGRSVDELFWKGARDAPLIQRIGVAIFALAYLAVAVVFVSIAIEQASWAACLFAALLFGVGAWFVRNALRK
ncbi:hypothetical protein SAMN05421770_104408 [Granulicella rosea]|uniref:Uncharacterized protein n=1 Tax=Granulicella rosea TaxID=474952 RepID=A0A239KBJ6_9BACT|nr:hypothetical protein [Granulicella rosea]SNT15108.1 hypothetical protein SAMN05421770_104408 [Granulicella rosea]